MVLATIAPSGQAVLMLSDADRHQLLEWFSAMSPSELIALGSTFSEYTASTLRSDLLPLDYVAGDLATAFCTVHVRDDDPPELVTEDIIARLDKHGVVAIEADSVMNDHDLLDDVQDFVLDSIYDPDYSFSSIGEPEFRKDLPLELNGVTAELFQRVLNVTGGALLELIGEDSFLTELSTMTSFPNAREQGRHPDTSYDGYTVDDIFRIPRLYSVYIALSDVDEDMAALDVWPGTHLNYHFSEYREYRDEFESLVKEGKVSRLDSPPLMAPAIRFTVRKGTVVIFDSRTMHRGTANTSPNIRPTMYFSFQAPGPDLDGSAGSLREKYRRAITLEDAIQGNWKVTTDEKHTHRWWRRTSTSTAECENAMDFHCNGWRDLPSHHCYDLCVNRFETIDIDESFFCHVNGVVEQICGFGLFADE